VAGVVTALADLTVGTQFLFACQVTATDPTAGLTLALYGPGRTEAATATISPAGVMAGQLAAAPDQVPVTVVTGFAPVSVGDVLESAASGETAVCRWSQIGADGNVMWSAAVDHKVIYPGTGWTIIGHVTL
jgi:hypothetical protein